MEGRGERRIRARTDSILCFDPRIKNILLTQEELRPVSHLDKINDGF